ncbi:hypothetical protein HXA34_19290 [Salipaludibacillus agaradhaerens]|uniref:ABC transporter ATP-binding protein n=1 Tax=Salipaludibacillus agaradhaerens TaxID=76935 RepID=UPI002151178F|nr:ABC transporter ATP-binding protein [Salipaludibacillus agaradhaerens]MCR6108451.1 hypothetical protein [Salipaludibacillus agaradhaerens]MCR6120472.1 hypothetical protein [Salipaludibacillus agaradhaerens]
MNLKKIISDDKRAIDEPFNALDDDSYERALALLSALKEDGKILVVAAHDQELVTHPFLMRSLYWKKDVLKGREVERTKIFLHSLRQT